MTAKEFLIQKYPEENIGLRSDLQKHRLRGLVEANMEEYLQLKLKEKQRLKLETDGYSFEAGV